MEIKLLNCPHCGGSAKIVTRYNAKSNNYFTFVKCTVCGSQGKPFNSSVNPESDGDNTVFSGATEAWNLRCPMATSAF